MRATLIASQFMFLQQLDKTYLDQSQKLHNFVLNYS